jgi:hypothetical protein
MSALGDLDEAPARLESGTDDDQARIDRRPEFVSVVGA